MPCPGKITNVHIPGATGSGGHPIYNDYKVPANYDSMLMKLIVYDKDRESAIAKMRSAPRRRLSLAELKPALTSIRDLENDAFQEGDKIDTSFIENQFPDYV